MSFYERYVQLCQKRNIRPSRAAEECGINRSNVTNWKNNGYTPRGDILQRLSNYFNVPVDVLLGEKEDAPTADGEREISNDEIKFALFGGEGEITDAMLDEVKQFAAFVREREAQKKKE